MATTQQIQVKLFTYSAIERRDEIEEVSDRRTCSSSGRVIVIYVVSFFQKYERCYQTLQSITNGLNDREYHDALTSHISKDKSQEEVISLGLLTSILLDPKNADKVCVNY